MISAFGADQKGETGFSLSAGQTRFDASGKPIASVAAPVEPLKVDSRSLDARYAEAVATGNTAEAQKLLQAKARLEAAGRVSGETSEPLVAIVGPDGEPVLVPRGQAVGKRPASNGEQGRPVVSGDAGRIADLDTSLNDLSTLSGTLEKSGATGTTAKLAASTPNWITDWTGIGADAKSKQAVIDRVKQVVGKALEGGVLRKEDEYKYEKILPTIADTASVVKTKLEGLDAAIRQRRQVTLDALSDAGYDVSKYIARGAPPKAPSGPSKVGRFTVTVEP